MSIIAWIPNERQLGAVENGIITDEGGVTSPRSPVASAPGEGRVHRRDAESAEEGTQRRGRPQKTQRAQKGRREVGIDGGKRLQRVRAPGRRWARVSDPAPDTTVGLLFPRPEKHGLLTLIGAHCGANHRLLTALEVGERGRVSAPRKPRLITVVVLNGRR